jgi:hypothetical protein
LLPFSQTLAQPEAFNRLSEWNLYKGFVWLRCSTGKKKMTELSIHYPFASKVF